MIGFWHNRRAMVFIALALPVLGFMFLANYQPRLGLLYHITKADVRIRFPDADERKCTSERLARAPVHFLHMTEEQRQKELSRRTTPSCGAEFRFGYRWVFVASLVFLWRAISLPKHEMIP